MLVVETGTWGSQAIAGLLSALIRAAHVAPVGSLICMAFFLGSQLGHGHVVVDQHLLCAVVADTIETIASAAQSTRRAVERRGRLLVILLLMRLLLRAGLARRSGATTLALRPMRRGRMTSSWHRRRESRIPRRASSRAARDPRLAVPVRSVLFGNEQLHAQDDFDDDGEWQQAGDLVGEEDKDDELDEVGKGHDAKEMHVVEE